MEPSSSLEGIAIITGGSRGIGRNTVLHLAKRGVRSIFTYNSNQAEAEKVTAEAREAGSSAVALQLNTGEISTFDAFVQEVKKALGDMGAERFDFLVNNAGTSHHNSIEQTTEEEMDSALQRPFQGRIFSDAKAAATDE